MKKNNFSKLLSKKYKKLTVPNFEEINYPEYLKELRSKLNMSQVTFAHAIGVSVNAVEKWEMNKNKVSGATQRLLYLLQNNDNLVDQIFQIQTVQTKLIKEYVFKTESIFVDENLSYKIKRKSSKTFEYFNTSDFTSSTYCSKKTNNHYA